MGAVDRFWAEARDAAEGPIDVLVNNAGIMHQTGGISDPIEEWDAVWLETMTVNVHAPARLLRHAVGDWLSADRPGAIIGSAAGWRRAAPRTRAPSPMPPRRPP